MNKSEQKRFDELYRKHLRAVKLQGKSGKTIDGYARAVQRISAWFDCCTDRLEPEQLAGYFFELVESHSWSTVKLDRCGLQFFCKLVLDRDWQSVEMIRAPKIRSLPDILSVTDIERLIGAARKSRYRVLVLMTYSMGLRLGETLARQGPQGPAVTVAGSDLPGTARLVVPASPSATAVPQRQRFDEKSAGGRVLFHGSKRRGRDLFHALQAQRMKQDMTPSVLERMSSATLCS